MLKATELKKADENLYRKLKACRVMAGVTVEEIAARWDVSRSRAYSKIRDISNLKLKDLRLLADLLGVSPAALLDDWK